MLTIRPFAQSDEDAVVALWQDCGLTRPWNDPRKDITRKLRVQPEMFLVAVLDGELIGSVMAGYDGHRGWVNYLAVAPGHQCQGFGRQLMSEAERLLHQAGCPKLNLQVRHDNAAAIAFYQRLGMREDAVLSFGKRLEHDEPQAG